MRTEVPLVALSGLVRWGQVHRGKAMKTFEKLKNRTKNRLRSLLRRACGAIGHYPAVDKRAWVGKVYATTNCSVCGTKLATYKFGEYIEYDKFRRLFEAIQGWQRETWRQPTAEDYKDVEGLVSFLPYGSPDGPPKGVEV